MNKVCIIVPFKENEERINTYGFLKTFGIAAGLGGGIEVIKTMMDDFREKKDVYFTIDDQSLSLLASEWDEIPIMYIIEQIQEFPMEIPHF